MLLRVGGPDAQMAAGLGDDSFCVGRAGARANQRYLRAGGGAMKTTLLEAIRERPLLGDGAMGTQLMLAGLVQGNSGEHWNLTHPEKVLAIQRRYAEAGSDCIITNTFGGSRIMLNRHSSGDRVVEINMAAGDIARQAFGDREGYILGDIGP